MWSGGSHSIVSSWATSAGPLMGTPGLLFFLTVIYPVMRHPHQLGAKAPVLCVVLPLHVVIIHDDRIFRNAGQYRLPGALPASRNPRRGAAYASASDLPVQDALASCTLSRSFPSKFCLYKPYCTMYCSTLSGVWYLIGRPPATRIRKSVEEISSCGASTTNKRCLMPGKRLSNQSRYSSASLYPGRLTATRWVSCWSTPAASCQVSNSSRLSQPIT